VLLAGIGLTVAALAASLAGRRMFEKHLKRS
jgi:hypothetical protein